MKADAALLFRSLAKRAELLARPFGFDITRRHHRDKDGHAAELVDQRFGKKIVPLQFRITPDLRLFPEELRDAHL